MRVNESVITVPELDNYDALVNAALGAAYTRSLNYRPGSTMLPPEANVTLTYAPAVSKGGAKNAPGTPLRQQSANVTVSAAAPTTYARGQVWLCTDSTLPGHRTFFLSLTTSPAAEVWFPLSDPSLLFAQDRALVLGDTATASSGGPTVPLLAPGTALTSGTTTDAYDGAEGLNGNGATLTIHANAVMRFGFGGFGTITFTGGAIPGGGTVGITEARGTAASNPIWSVMQTGPNSYIIGGTKLA